MFSSAIYQCSFVLTATVAITHTKDLAMYVVRYHRVANYVANRFLLTAFEVDH